MSFVDWLGAAERDMFKEADENHDLSDGFQGNSDLKAIWDDLYAQYSEHKENLSPSEESVILG